MKLSKHSALWVIAARNIRRFPGRVFAVLLPLIIIMSYASTMTFMRDGICRDALTSAKVMPDITVQQSDNKEAEEIKSGLIKEISTYPNVVKVVPRIWEYIRAKAIAGDETYALMGIDLDQMPGPENVTVSIESGRYLTGQDNNAAVIGSEFATRKKLRSGDKIALEDSTGKRTEFSISGIFTSRVHAHAANLIITDIRSAGRFLGYGNDRFSDIGVYLKDPAYAEQVSGLILASNNNVKTINKGELYNNIKKGYGVRSGVFQLMWLILLLTVLLLAWTQSCSISLDMRKEIGILKAIGWQTLDIIELKMMEVLIIGLMGVLSGILLGILYLTAGAPIANEYFLGSAASYPRFSMPVYIEWSSLFLLIVTGIFPLCAATIFSAWLMGTIEPDSAIRGG